MRARLLGRQFQIRTSRANVKVSWQITGIRNDPYSRSLRAPAQQPKPAADRGRYLYPAGYGKPAYDAIDQQPKLLRAAEAAVARSAAAARRPAAVKLPVAPAAPSVVAPKRP